MKLTTTILLFAIPFFTFSQSIIKGTVSDDIGPLDGANIIIKNSKIGTVSDINGNYEIEVQKKDIISISYLGFTTKEISIGSKKKYRLY